MVAAILPLGSMVLVPVLLKSILFQDATHPFSA
jgi:hypothetical protein